MCYNWLEIDSYINRLCKKVVDYYDTRTKVEISKANLYSGAIEVVIYNFFGSHNDWYKYQSIY